MARWRMKVNRAGELVPCNGGRYPNIQKCEVDGIKFDSPREADRYQDLKILERAKVIEELEIHPAIPIVIGGVEVKYPSGRQLKYVADFRYFDLEKGERIVEDVKFQSGHRPRDYQIKRALVLAMGIEINEV